MNQNPLELVKNQEIFENMIDYNITLDDNSDKCPLCDSDLLLTEGRCVTCLDCRMVKM